MDERSRALQISLRLKAARYLAGSEKTRANATTGKTHAVPLEPKDLAKRSPLPENKITANKIFEIETMQTYVPPSHVALLSEALGIDLESLPLLPTGATEPDEVAGFPPPGAVGRFEGDDQPTHGDRSRSRNRKEGDAAQGDAG